MEHAHVTINIRNAYPVLIQIKYHIVVRHEWRTHNHIVGSLRKDPYGTQARYLWICVSRIKDISGRRDLKPSIIK